LGYILQQVEKPPERKNEDSDDEGGEEEEDAEEVEEFEADLDISDCFPIPPKKDYLLDYVIDRPIPAFDQMKDSNEVFRPTTPGQRRINGEGRESIVIGESVNIDLSNRNGMN